MTCTHYLPKGITSLANEEKILEFLTLTAELGNFLIVIASLCFLVLITYRGYVLRHRHVLPD